MFGQVEQLLCQIAEYLRQIVILLGGKPLKPGAAPRSSIGRGSFTFQKAGPPPVLLVYANPSRAALVLENMGPGDLYITSGRGDVTGFPIIAGMALSFPGVTEEIYAFTDVVGTTAHWLEVVEVG
ncbi:MAG: hypothetical protein C4292_05965 [Nitrososphaera sp.]